MRRESIPIMPKMIFFNVPASGHVNPTLPLVAELVRRGVEVIYYLTPAYRAGIEATGAQYRAYDSRWVTDDYFDTRGLDGSNPIGAAHALVTTSRDMLPALIQILKEERPDAVVFDSMCPWGKLAADAAGIYAISSLGLLLITPAMMVQSGLFGNLFGILRKNLGKLREYGQIANEIRKAHQIAVPRFPDLLLNRGALTLSYTTPQIQPGGERMDGSIKFVGPMIAPRLLESDFPFDQLDEIRPLIYISLGTVINNNLEFYRNCVQAFAGLTEYQVVMSVGKRINVRDVGFVPDHVMVRQHVPQLEILKRAAVFITHAGMNSTHEALYYNVPMILVPQQVEQNFVARRLERLGVGLVIDDPTMNAIRIGTRRVLAMSHYAHNAREVGDAMRKLGGVTRAADEVMKHLNVKQMA